MESLLKCLRSSNDLKSLTVMMIAIWLGTWSPTIRASLLSFWNACKAFLLVHMQVITWQAGKAQWLIGALYSNSCKCITFHRYKFEAKTSPTTLLHILHSPNGTLTEVYEETSTHLLLVMWQKTNEVFFNPLLCCSSHSLSLCLFMSFCYIQSMLTKWRVTK